MGTWKSLWYLHASPLTISGDKHLQSELILKDSNYPYPNPGVRPSSLREFTIDLRNLNVIFHTNMPDPKILYWDYPDTLAMINRIEWFFKNHSIQVWYRGKGHNYKEYVYHYWVNNDGKHINTFYEFCDLLDLPTDVVNTYTDSNS